MAIKRTIKFWIIFWSIAIIFLGGWYFYWETKNQGPRKLINVAMEFLPLNELQKKEFGALGAFANYFLKNDNQEKTFLVLMQNNLEIRPGGGFIGAFGIVKIKNGKVTMLQTHDLSNFDGRIPDTVEPPYPMKETLKIKSWKLRDSNYSPDFSVNAQKAIEFYYMGQGEEQFDGVIGITTNTLSSMLKATGPIQIEGYPGTYDSDNAIIALEYQVEKAFEDQGIERGERKSVMNDLAKEIEKRIMNLSASQKLELAKILLADLNSKDIQFYFSDPNMQQSAINAGWAGVVDPNYDKNYLMAVDANLGAYKSDYYVNRSMDYTVDYSKEDPTVNLKITYKHNAKQRDWMTKDYLSYLRIYVPAGSWYTDGKNFDGVRFGDELGKKYFGAIVKVPLGSEKTFEINYTLPKELKEFPQDLKIQKQTGLHNIPVSVHIIKPSGEKVDYEFTLNSDTNL